MGIQWHGAESRKAPAIVVAASTSMVAGVDPYAGGSGGQLDGVGPVSGSGQFGGLLGKGFDPLTLGDVTRDEIAVPALVPHSDLPPVRMTSRQSLLAAIEHNMKAMENQKLVLCNT